MGGHLEHPADGGDRGSGSRPRPWRAAALGLAVVLQTLALIAHLTSHTADATTDPIGGRERFAVATHPGQAAHLDAPAPQSPPDDSPCLCGHHGSAPERAPTARQDLPARGHHRDATHSSQPASPTPAGPARAPPAA